MKRCVLNVFNSHTTTKRYCKKTQISNATYWVSKLQTRKFVNSTIKNCESKRTKLNSPHYTLQAETAAVPLLPFFVLKRNLCVAPPAVAE